MQVDLPPLSLAEIMSSIALIGSIIAFLRRPGDRAAEAVAAVTTKVEGLEERVAVVESELEHLPDRELVHAMELSLRDLQGEMKVLVERIKPIAATSARLEAFLLDQGK